MDGRNGKKVKKLYKTSEATRARAKVWYENNKERRRAYKAEWDRKNKESVKEYNKAYHNKHKDSANAKTRDRYASDLHMKFYNLVRNAYHRVTGKRLGNNKVIDLLGCTLEEYQDYIESKFQPGMTWENHKRDGWHIDHILPLRESNIPEEEKLKRLHYTNTQPLWAKENISKGNNIVYNPEN